MFFRFAHIAKFKVTVKTDHSHFFSLKVIRTVFNKDFSLFLSRPTELLVKLTDREKAHVILLF